MGIFDIIKSFASGALNSGSEKIVTELSKKIVEKKLKAGGHTDVEINEVQKILATRNPHAANQDVMMEEALKKQGYSPDQIKDFIAKTKTVNTPK